MGGKTKLAEKIFSVKNQESKNSKWHKVVTILGLKFKFKSQKLTDKKLHENLKNSLQELKQDNEKLKKDIYTYIEQHNENLTNEIKQYEKLLDLKDSYSNLLRMQRVRALHSQVFPKFKNIHANKDVVIVATGPSLNDYKPIENAIHIGVNKAFKVDSINLDYLFMQDYHAAIKYIEESYPYKNQDLIRFYGIEPYGKKDNFIIPESIALRHNALRYYVYGHTSYTTGPVDDFAYDLTSEELYGTGSTVFSAINFALWTNPKRICLVGCDCSALGHFDTQDKTQANVNLIKHYILLKKFVNEYYPETEIVSINPVGLKGIFKDIYTT